MVQAKEHVEAAAVSTASTFKVATPTRHIDALQPHPDNPREDVDPKSPKIIELAESIVRCGVLEPLVINKDNQIYAGHRRRIASRVAYELTNDAKFLIVPVVINDSPPEAALEIMLQENMQRESLNLLEEARAMYALMDRKKLTVADLARQIAMPAKDISPRLAILKCEEQVQALFALDELPLSAAILFARIYNAEQQIHYAGLLARRQLTLGKLKEIANSMSVPLAPAPTAKEAEQETTRDIPAPHSKKGKRGHKLVTGLSVGNTATSKAPPSREEAMAALQRAISAHKRGITLFNFQTVTELVCCACGMVGEVEICRSCPLPRLILGVIGRAD